MTHNRSLGQAAGVPEEKLDALEGDYADSGLFTDEEVAVIRWAEVVATNTARRDRDAFAALRRHFDDSEIVELTAVVAIRAMVNLIQEALWTDLEDADFPKNDRPAIGLGPHEWIAWYSDVLAHQTGDVPPRE